MSLVEESIKVNRSNGGVTATLALADIPPILSDCTVHGPVRGRCTGITLDSRAVRPGMIFAALAGTRSDGALHIDEAVRNGAIAVLVGDHSPTDKRSTYIVVPDPRRALARLSCELFGHPSSRLRTIGVTGTNGKSTVALLIRAILSEGGFAPGIIGTLGYDVGGRWIPPDRTTPESPELQHLLHTMTQHGRDSAVMEVSSHALAQQRTHGVKFHARVFTNLSEDHLDYHASMESYFQTKALLFDDAEYASASGTTIVNVDDPWGRKLILRGGMRAHTLTYGFAPEAIVRAEHATLDARGSSFHLRSPWGDAEIRMNLLGRFNISNALAAVAAAGSQGIDVPTMAQALERTEPLSGRLEAIDNDHGINVFVDYAHTEDALSNALKTLREVHEGNLTVVFGCGGERDQAKRPRMGAVAARLADRAIVTTDNPRGEDIGDIIHEVTRGCGDAENVETVEDRRAAISLSLRDARPGDVVLVAGKGHETTQHIGARFYPFDDREVIRDILRGLDTKTKKSSS